MTEVIDDIGATRSHWMPPDQQENGPWPRPDPGKAVYIGTSHFDLNFDIKARYTSSTVASFEIRPEPRRQR